LYRTFEFGPNPGNLTYKYYADSELLDDATFVIATTTHDPFTCGDVEGDTLVEYTGVWFIPGVEVLSLAPYANQTVTLVFLFVSDYANSDEDGGYWTWPGGPFVVDSITVQGTTSGDQYFNFETGDLQGWSRCAFAGYGDYAGIYTIANLNIQDPSCPCLSGCALAFFNRDVIPHDHVMGQANVAVSPEINLLADPLWPRSESFIRTAMYLNLPLAAGNFVIWKVRYQPSEDDTCGFCDKWSPWYDENTIYYGGGCQIGWYDLSGKVPAHAEKLQIGVGVQNMCLVWPWWCVQPGNESPMFDNIRFAMVGGRAPAVVISDWDFFQDSFATDGTLLPRSTGRNIFPLTGGVQVHTVLGDTLVGSVAPACPSRLPQGVQNPDAVINLYFRVFPGPCIDQMAYNAWIASFPKNGAWYYARMDTARESIKNRVETAKGYYMSRFHETDPHYKPAGDNDIIPDFLFTPGTTIEYFVQSYWIGTPGIFYIYPDTTGGIYEEVEVLPDIMNPNINCDTEIGPGEQNCMLYVDHWDWDGEYAANSQAVIERGFHALGLGPVTKGANGWWDLQQWDRYDNEGSTADEGNSLGGGTCQDVNDAEGLRAVGPTLAQVLNYHIIFWSAGDQYDLILAYGGPGNCADDVSFLEGWMDIPRQDPVLFWLNANGSGTFLLVNGDASTAAFASAYLGVDLVASSYRDYTGDYGDCPDVWGVVGTAPEWNEDFHCGLEQAFLTDCGVGYKWFNVLTPVATTQAAYGILQYGAQVGPGEFASIAHDATADTATVSLYKTVADGFSLEYLRKYEPYCDSDVCVAWWEADVIGGPYYNRCFGNLQLVAEDEGGIYNARFANKLGNSYPNPMNPSARIDFSIKESGRATLRVFDVSGRLINTLVDKKMDAGNHFVVWDGTDSWGRSVASGVYFYQIEANGYKEAKKIMVLK